jgi:hypothetical protein
MKREGYEEVIIDLSRQRKELTTKLMKHELEDRRKIHDAGPKEIVLSNRRTAKFIEKGYNEGIEPLMTSNGSL